MDNLPIPTRRKLLRGTLAAPLVLTVASPSALGQAVTSFQECIARAADQPQPTLNPLLAFTEVEDKIWHRIQVQIWEGNISSVAGGKQNFYKLDGMYYPVSGGTCPATGYASFTSQERYLYDRWALVFVDTSGRPGGYGLCQPAGTYAVSYSCWMSFKPAG